MSLFALVPFVKLVPYASFGLFAVVAWLMLEYMGGRKPRAGAAR